MPRLGRLKVVPNGRIYDSLFASRHKRLLTAGRPPKHGSFTGYHYQVCNWIYDASPLQPLYPTKCPPVKLCYSKNFDKSPKVHLHGISHIRRGHRKIVSTTSRGMYQWLVAEKSCRNRHPPTGGNAFFAIWAPKPWSRSGVKIPSFILSTISRIRFHLGCG